MLAFSLPKAETARNAHFWAERRSREGQGSWEMAPSRLWLTRGPQSGLVAKCMLTSLLRLISAHSMPSFAFLFSSFFPPSAPCVFRNLRHYAADKCTSRAPCMLAELPKTFMDTMTAIFTSAEIWHRALLCLVRLKQSRYRCHSMHQQRQRCFISVIYSSLFVCLFS